MFIKKILNKKIIFVGIGAIVLLGVIGGGYYWWTGTPEYSISQIKKAIETHNPELGLKYIDTDAIFENLWTDMKTELMKEIEEAEGFEAFGMMLGIQLAESMKPALKEQVKQGVKSWFSASTEEKPKETTSAKESLEFATVWQQKDLKIQKQGNFAYIELPDNVKIIFTKKEGERYWVISKIEGFAESLFPKETQQESTATEENKQVESEESIIENGIGDEVVLTTIKFKIDKVEEKQYLSHSIWGITATAREDTKFILISMSVTNITNDSFALNFGDIYLIDQNERKFFPYERSIGSVDDYLQMRRLSPGIKESGSIIYELPKDATGYSLVIGKAGTNEVYRVILK